MKNKIVIRIISIMILCSMIGYFLPVLGFTKEETVYSKLDASGKDYKTIVSTHIKNTENENTIEDISDLLNVKNTKGEETYTQDGTSFSWNANKNDIYYQGESTKKLPIECNIKYELDGVEISKDEILGKSGKVKISLQYKNNEEKIVNINGKNEKMYVPFVVMAGTIINNDKNKNIVISNGKTVDDGTKTVVVGIAMPGLKESLGVSDNDIKIPNNIEITMDATEFESNSIVTYVTPKILENSDLKIFDKMDDIYNKISILQDSMSKIQEGANNLSNGTQIYAEKSQKFYGAMNQISEGVSSVNSNYMKIYNGIGTVKQGTSKISKGSQELNDGIKLLTTKLGSLPENVSKLYKGSSNLKTGISDISTGVNKLETNLTDVVTSLAETNAELQSAVSALKSAGYTDSDDLIKEYNAKIINNTNKIKEINSNESKLKMKELNDGLDSAKTGATTINRGLETLDNESKELPSSLAKLYSGSSELQTGSTELNTGATELNTGAITLKNGIQTLDTSTQSLKIADEQLVRGAETLADGSSTLKNGIKDFNEQGIEKICKYINENTKNLTSRIQKLKDLSEQYNNFTLLDNKNNGNVKFIMIIDAIKKQENKEKSKENVILDENIINKED